MGKGPMVNYFELNSMTGLPKTTTLFVTLLSHPASGQPDVEMDDGLGDCACAVNQKLPEVGCMNSLPCIGGYTRPSTPIRKGASAMSKETSPDLEFENREYELNRIANPTGPQRIVIDAPPEYGKTYLLRKVEEMYRPGTGAPWENWRCVLIDLAYPDYERDQYAILNAVSTLVADKRMETANATELAEHIAGQTRDVLLLFDSADRREQEIRWLVHEVIPELTRRLKIPGRKIRVVFAGRYISRRGWAWPDYTVVELTEFNEEIILRMIWKMIEEQYRDQTSRPQLGPDDAQKLAREIALLSGGHPGSIREMLQDLQRHHWAIELDDKGHLDPKTRARLFGYADSKARKILEHVPRELQEILRTLSIFRRYQVNTIQALQMREEISGISRSLNALDLLTRLADTGLIRYPTQADLFYADGIIRGLLLAQIQFGQPRRYLELNRLACEIYDAWVESKDLDGNDLRGQVLGNEQVIYMVESLYHFLHCQDKGPSLDEVEQKIQGYIPKLRSAFGDSPEFIDSLKQQLKSSIYGDSEIRRRLRDLFGDSEASDLLDRTFREREQ